MLKLVGKVIMRYDPLNPHDASKHHFKFLKNGSFSKIRTKILWNCFNNINIFFSIVPTSSHLHPLQFKNCDSNSRLVVDEEDIGKFKLDRVKICCLRLSVLIELALVYC